MTAQSEIRIIGTSHISKKSAAQIRKAFEEFQPDIIAVELDRRRLQSLQEMAAGKRPGRPPLSLIRQVGLLGWLFLAIGGWLQRKLADIVKVMPGVDMLAAVQLSQEHEKRLALVDQDVAVTMRRLSKHITWREKARIVWDVLTAPFQRKKFNVRLDGVPDEKTIKELMGMLRERYPSIYHALIVERNIVMATKLDRIARAHPGKILLVVGAGHEEDLRERLSRSELFTEFS